MSYEIRFEFVKSCNGMCGRSLMIKKKDLSGWQLDLTRKS